MRAFTYTEPVHSNYICFHSGATQENIEAETGAKIRFPSSIGEDSISTFLVSGQVNFHFSILDLDFCNLM